MAQFTRLAAAIAAASLAGAVNAGTMQTGDAEVTFSGEVILAAQYQDQDASGSSSNFYLDTAWLEVAATQGAVSAGIALDYGDNVVGEVVDNAYINYKLNDNYTLFMKHDDTYMGFQKATSKWNDTLNDGLVDHDGDEMYGVEIKGGPISSTIYLMNGQEEGEDDLQNFGTSVDFEHDMFTAHFGYVSSISEDGVSDSITTVTTETASDGTTTYDVVETVDAYDPGEQGAFSVGGTVTLNNILLAAEYNWLSDSVEGEDPTFLHLGAEYTMNQYTFIASYETTDEAEVLGLEIEDRIALAVNADINDMLYVQAEIDFDSTYGDNDDINLEVAVGAAF